MAWAAVGSKAVVLLLLSFCLLLLPLWESVVVLCYKSSDFDVNPRLHILNFHCFVRDEFINGSF